MAQPSPLPERLREGVIALVALVGVLSAGNALARHLQPAVVVASAGLSRAQQEQMEHNAATSLFGQFRSSMADFLWLKADRYIHKGVEIRAMTAQELAMNSAGQATSADKNDHREHRNETSVVPGKAYDWRGRLGDLEREIQPYEDMEHHHHEDPSESLPLFKLMTISNPNFIPGYVVGASMMARDPTKLQEALAFLAEGERNNPESIEIQECLAYLNATHTRDFTTAALHAERGLGIASNRDFNTLSEDEKEAYESALRWAVLSNREAGKIDHAKKIARWGLTVFPNDITCRRMLGMVL